MNHQNIYNQIISKAQSENRIKVKFGEYFENHHIIPKCLNGSNSKENKVLLTAKEHFICHKLLVEIYPDNKKLFYAMFMMCYSKNKNIQRHFKISSREYSRINKTNSELASEKFSGINNPNFGKTGILNPRTGIKVTDDIKNKISLGNSGKIRSKEMNKINSLNKKEYFKTHCSKNKDKIMSVEQKIKISDKVKENWNDVELREIYVQSAKNRKKVICPKCLKSVDKSTSLIWHFDNCGRTKSLRTNEYHPDQKIKNKISNTLKNKPKIKCQYCDFESGNTGILNRWHNDNCKFKK